MKALFSFHQNLIKYDIERHIEMQINMHIPQTFEINSISPTTKVSPTFPSGLIIFLSL